MKLKVTITKSQERCREVSRIVDVPDDLQGKPKEIQEWLDDNAEDLTFNIAPDEWDDQDSEEVIAINGWEGANDETEQKDQEERAFGDAL